MMSGISRSVYCVSCYFANLYPCTYTNTTLFYDMITTALLCTHVLYICLYDFDYAIQYNRIGMNGKKKISEMWVCVCVLTGLQINNLN